MAPARSRYADPASSRRSAPFLPYIHRFRAVAILAVVASHVNLRWSMDTLRDRILLTVVQNATVLFLFVAGFLFQYLSPGFGYIRYLKSKLQYVIIPYVVVSIPLLVYQAHVHAGMFSPANPWHQPSLLVDAALSLLTAEQRPAPLWFIPMIALLYLGAPLLLAIDRRPRLYWCILPLLLVAMFAHRPLPVNRIGQALVYFSPAYLAGMWFSRYREPVMRFIDDHLGGLFVVCLAVEIVNVGLLKRPGPIYSHHWFTTENGVVDLGLPNKILLSFALVGLLARHQTAVGNKLDFLAGASFGVFFVHGSILDLFERLALRLHHRPLEAGFFNLLALTTLCILVSLGLVALARAVAGKRSRYLVGC